MFIARGTHQSPKGATCTIRLNHGLYGLCGLHGKYCLNQDAQDPRRSRIENGRLKPVGGGFPNRLHKVTSPYDEGH